MTSELRHAVEVASAVYDECREKGIRDGGALIEADREAVRAEVVGKIVAWLREEARGPYFADLIEAKFGKTNVAD